ncbi:MAG: hypothetical protein U1F52_21590 [Burkholderiales bacterium]
MSQVRIGGKTGRRRPFFVATPKCVGADGFVSATEEVSLAREGPSECVDVAAFGDGFKRATSPVFRVKLLMDCAGAAEMRG